MAGKLAAPQSAAELRARWEQLRTARRLRNRDAAEVLGVSEAELIATMVGERATRLGGDFRELLRRAGELGEVLALTRNHACVHEKDGAYENVSWDGPVGLALGERIDLRLFFAHWRYGYACAEPGPDGLRRSLQFFDAAGEAVHKIFLRAHSSVVGYESLVAAFAAPDQTPGERVVEAPAPPTEAPDGSIDVDGFRAAWAAMQDTHEFFALLKRFGVTRTQGLRLAGDQFAASAPPARVQALLEAVARDALPIMVFVGNRGCIQIHSGPVRHIKAMDRWLNVLDPGFNLHLRQDLVDRAWIVRKPTADGVVTSLELFDREGRTIAMLFGQRKPGVPELPAWRETLDRLFPEAAR
jgi:putative hemin transport protein